MLDSDTCIHIMKHDPRMRPKAPVGNCGISQIVLVYDSGDDWIRRRNGAAFSEVAAPHLQMCLPYLH